MARVWSCPPQLAHKKKNTWATFCVNAFSVAAYSQPDSNRFAIRRVKRARVERVRAEHDWLASSSKIVVCALCAQNCAHIIIFDVITSARGALIWNSRRLRCTHTQKENERERLCAEGLTGQGFFYVMTRTVFKFVCIQSVGDRYKTQYVVWHFPTKPNEVRTLSLPPTPKSPSPPCRFAHILDLTTSFVAHSLSGISFLLVLSLALCYRRCAAGTAALPPVCNINTNAREKRTRNLLGRTTTTRARVYSLSIPKPHAGAPTLRCPCPYRHQINIGVE